MTRWPERLGRGWLGRSGLGRGWLGPVLLLVLLAAAGMPERAIQLGSPQRMARHEEGAVRSIAHEAAETQPRAGQAATERSQRMPRVMPRARSVTEAGLPMPRAPTA